MRNNYQTWFPNLPQARFRTITVRRINTVIQLEARCVEISIVCLRRFLFYVTILLNPIENSDLARHVHIVCSNDRYTERIDALSLN